MKIAVSDQLIKYIVPKGFIAIDGTSLTICDVKSNDGESGKNWFTIMLVSHTQQAVIFPCKCVGDAVNIEVDVLAKIVESSLKSEVDHQLASLKNEVNALRKELNDVKNVLKSQ